jgi:hypothetical protein
MAWVAKMERLAIGERIAAAGERLEAERGRWGRPRRMVRLTSNAPARCAGRGALTLHRHRSEDSKVHGRSGVSLWSFGDGRRVTARR